MQLFLFFLHFLLDFFARRLYNALVNQQIANDMNDLNKINSNDNETVYIVLDKDTGDIQEVDSCIGHALEAHIPTVTVGIDGDSKKLTIDNLSFDLKAAADSIGVFITLHTAATVILKGFIPQLSDEAARVLVIGAYEHESVKVILAGF